MEKEQKVLLIIIIIAFSLRLFYLSPWLEDWDSVQFALGIHHFSIPDHQPHPPGYILYIFLGKITDFFFNNATLSLTLISALLGSLSAIPFFLLAKNIMSKYYAFLVTILLLLTPIQWMLSEVALTLIPGMFFTITTAYLLYKGTNTKSYLMAGSLLAGISIGVRFAEYSIVILLLILVNFWQIKRLPSIFNSFGLFFLGIIIWLLPTLMIAGSEQFISSFLSHSDYIISHDSILSEIIPLSRTARFLQLFTEGYSQLFLVILLLSLWQLTKLFKDFHNFKVIFLVVWLFSYLIPLLFIYNLELSRYTLPILPPLILLAFLTIQNIRFKKIFTIIYISFICILFFISISSAEQLKHLIPPTIAPVIFVNENFIPQKTTLITTYIFRQFQYYAPNFTNFYGVDNAPAEISTDFVIVDYAPLEQQIPALSKYYIYDQKKFSGPSTIFPRVYEVELTILKRK